MKICEIPDCNRTPDTDICRMHEAAKENIGIAFFQWKTAYGVNYSWEKYLKALLKDGIGVGDLVQDIAKVELTILGKEEQ